MVALRSLLVLFAALLLGAATAPQVYTLAPTNSEAILKVPFLGLGSKTAGLPKVAGTIRFDEANPTNIDLKMSIDATALTAGDRVTLNRLKSEKFLWVEKYPEVTFHGTKLALSNPTQGTVTGMLSVRGVTREESFAVTFDKPPLTSVGEPIEAVCTATINRRNYGMTAFGLIVGKNVKITLKTRLVPG